jgi:hypothetical protein
MKSQRKRGCVQTQGIKEKVSEILLSLLDFQLQQRKLKNRKSFSFNKVQNSGVGGIVQMIE